MKTDRINIISYLPGEYSNTHQKNNRIKIIELKKGIKYSFNGVENEILYGSKSDNCVTISDGNRKSQLQFFSKDMLVFINPMDKLTFSFQRI